ncbi:NAD(P)H-dependent oxidoreductase [Chitinophaga flava]|uniref:NAD(P)H-dependent oxidoreductase n=1 Tax=Chitinophaga flava TaxID=2259036 RepID=A0A365Y2D1_9BACT|nr:NAD(P)H-dependent oxidoreductase [Chitinophaga flava]RBL92401.1 NAD(P)H-dependent oxidoreductase [Chitinophaga flava]
MDFIKNMEWRYATKKFDTTRKISRTELDLLKRSIQLTPSPYGLQLYKVIIIASQELKEMLKPISQQQHQITDCSHLFVFCNYSMVKDEYIDDYIRTKSGILHMDTDRAAANGASLKAKIAEKTPEQTANWLKNQTYLALGSLLTACADLKIDACPMEGFEPKHYNTILRLEEKGLNACVIAATGYRSAEDKVQYNPKVRKPAGLLFEEI